jgi:hypothetical protein
MRKGEARASPVFCREGGESGNSAGFRVILIINRDEGSERDGETLMKILFRAIFFSPCYLLISPSSL